MTVGPARPSGEPTRIAVEPSMEEGPIHDC
jgi:hypothetical protein